MHPKGQPDVVIDEQNKRLKVMLYHPEEIEQLHGTLVEMAHDRGMTKLIIYAKKADVKAWEALGYRLEGRIDGFFHGENAQMMSCFLTAERGASVAPELAEEVLGVSLEKQAQVHSGGRTDGQKSLPTGYTLREAREDDAEELARLYDLVFATYPTPMNEAEYVRETMRESTYYIVVEKEGQIVCAASSEVTPKFGSAELTDCATHPDHLGLGLLQPIFTALEEKMEQIGVYYLYTLTRAQSHGMNVTAAKHGYEYRGRLINNCTIYSGFEDMNIWVKPLRETWE
ncbi:putative beta-lysine N-acetyltransferase [Brevibacillus dissolubilis]|uniref:putative beta-lysine N-acetyltransferase n=1 Tax=Brevibacillus dissolubilis TaxID=1844116 RepID=UPI0011177F3D|nr:putative beta-lysine N-acetyltransferase [Brevibacillus dissolubilis]